MTLDMWCFIAAVVLALTIIICLLLLRPKDLWDD